VSILRFEDIIAWQKTKFLALEIYKSFKNCRDYAFRDQMHRASDSIMNNFAERFERKSNKDFQKFLFISKGSCGEVRSMLYLALELKYISNEQFDILKETSLTISKLLSGLIRTLKK